MAAALSRGVQQYANIAKALPRTIEQAVEAGIPMKVMNQVAPVTPFLEYQLINLAARLNVDQRLTLQDHQIPDIAQELLEMYPAESIEDLTIAMRRGSMGQYGEVYRVDGAVIGMWMKKYLSEKYAVVERNLNNQKQSKFDAMKDVAQDKNNLLKLYYALTEGHVIKDDEAAYRRWREEQVFHTKDIQHDSETDRAPEPGGEGFSDPDQIDNNVGPPSEV